LGIFGFTHGAYLTLIDVLAARSWVSTIVAFPPTIFVKLKSFTTTLAFVDREFLSPEDRYVYSQATIADPRFVRSAMLDAKEDLTVRS
jgi:hypothetical protein